MKLTISFFLPILAVAQVSAPIVGYSVRDAQREVRVILGVPGATHYSEPVAWPADAASVRTTPGHRWLLVLRGDSAAASVWIPETGAERALSSVNGEPALISFSPSGSAAAFLWRDENRLVVYAGLPDSPTVTLDIQTRDYASLSVNESGELIAAASSTGELRLLGKDSDKLIREARALASFAFFGDTLAVAEPGSDRVEFINTSTLARNLIQLPAPVTSSARLVPGGRDWFSLADPDAASIYRIEPGTGEVRTSTLQGFTVSALETLRPRGATLLKTPDGDVPRIVLSHADGDDLFYLPTLSEEQPR